VAEVAGSTSAWKHTLRPRWNPPQIEQSLGDIFDHVQDRGPGGHILTGPVYIEGTDPGDVLLVWRFRGGLPDSAIRAPGMAGWYCDPRLGERIRRRSKTHRRPRTAGVNHK
jgi:hypothetical protein